MTAHSPTMILCLSSTDGGMTVERGGLGGGVGVSYVNNR